MAITKQTISLADGVNERGQVQVKTITRMLEDGIVVGESVHNKVLNPGDSLTGEAAQVVAVANTVWTPDVITAWLAGQGDASIEAKRQATWLAIRAKRDSLSDTGGYKVSVGGVDKWFHSDGKSKTQQLGLLMAGPSIPPGLQWKTLDGSFVTMTQALAGQIFQAAMAQDAAIFRAAETHRVAMEASADPTAYDFSAGWPAVYEGA